MIELIEDIFASRPISIIRLSSIALMTAYSNSVHMAKMEILCNGHVRVERSSPQKILQWKKCSKSQNTTSLEWLLCRQELYQGESLYLAVNLMTSYLQKLEKKNLPHY